jgi:hypothetical protein
MHPLRGFFSTAAQCHRLRDVRSHLLQAAASEYGEVIALDDGDIDAAQGERAPSHLAIQEQAFGLPSAAQERYFPGV